MVSLQTVGQLGENESLRRTVSRLSNSEHAIVGSGDDAAVVAQLLVWAEEEITRYRKWREKPMRE